MIKTPDNIAELIIRYSDGQPLDDREAALLWEWLGSDQANRDLLYESKYMLHNMKIPAEIDLERCYEELSRRIAAAGSSAKKPLRRTLTRRIAVYAASVVAAAAIGAGLTYLIQPVSEPAYAQVSAGPGHTSRIVLPDGTEVVLKPSSTISYPTSFDKKERRVTLDGEAFFEVAKDEHKPFLVESERQQVRVLGTSFNIMAYPGYGINQVSLVTGSVELSVFDSDGSLSNSFVMTPEQLATFNLASGSVTVDSFGRDDRRNWTDNTYYFDKTMLSEITKRLGHYYDAEIIIDDPDAGSVLYSGTLSLDMSLKEVLSALNIEKDLQIDGSGRQFVLKKKKDQP